MQFFKYRIYQVYPNISFLKNRYDMDMTWSHGYDILPKNIPDVVISMSYPWDMT